MHSPPGLGIIRFGLKSSTEVKSEVEKFMLNELWIAERPSPLVLRVIDGYRIMILESRDEPF